MPPKFMPHIQEALLRILLKPLSYSYGSITLYGIPFQRTSDWPDRLKKQSCNTTSLTYYYARFSLPCAVFGRSYSPHPNWFLFLQVLRRFNSLCSLTFRSLGEVTFRHLRFKAYMLLAGEYRSLSRPSSASQTESST